MPGNYLDQAIRKINRAFGDAAITGERQYVERLQRIVDKAIRERNRFTPQEREAISGIYAGFGKDVATGEYLNGLLALTGKVLNYRGKVADETDEQYIQRKFREEFARNRQKMLAKLGDGGMPGLGIMISIGELGPKNKYRQA